MSEATPTTDQVRRLYAYTRAGDRIHPTDEYFAQFDRWLAAREERVRAEEREKALQDACEAAERQVQLASLVAGRPSDFEKGVMSALAAIRAVPEQDTERSAE